MKELNRNAELKILIKPGGEKSRQTAILLVYSSIESAALGLPWRSL
jgi:hypothetical protein